MKPNSRTVFSERTLFFLRNLLKGLLWLSVIVGGYFYLKANYSFTLQGVLGPLYDQPLVIYVIFLISEVVFGIIPPELFMIWSLRNELVLQYIANVAALSIISYMAGLIGYYLGSHFSTTHLYRVIRVNYLRRFERRFNQFGGFLVVVAAITPLPFSGICMLTGAVKYPYRRFLYFSMIRFVRFAVYAAIIWEANVLN